MARPSARVSAPGRCHGSVQQYAPEPVRVSDRHPGLRHALPDGTFVVVFRSLRIAVIAIFPNLLAISCVLGVMGWLGIPLDMMTITIAAIGVGLADDDTIHYIHRFRHEVEATGSYRTALHRSHGSIGHAIYYTTVTLAIGFSILSLSSFVPTTYFGLLTVLAITMALLASLTVLPQLLVSDQALWQGTRGQEEQTGESTMRVCLLVLAGIVAGAGCATSPRGITSPGHGTRDVNAPGETSIDELEEELSQSQVTIADPLEPVNRFMHGFNDILYFWVLKPVTACLCGCNTQARSHRDRQTSFTTWRLRPRFFNCLLQGKGPAADTELHRFVINTVEGVLGFGDPARDKWGIERVDEDLGQTLAVYGLGDGCYLVWPLMVHRRCGIRWARWATSV